MQKMKKASQRLYKDKVIYSIKLKHIIFNNEIWNKFQCMKMRNHFLENMCSPNFLFSLFGQP